jgi:hypothetical protein
MKDIKVELYNDHFQNYKRYNIPKAQLVIADNRIEKATSLSLYLMNPKNL